MARRRHRPRRRAPSRSSRRRACGRRAPRPSPAGRRRPAASSPRFAGFIKQTVMPPSPPAQVDWVILQRFASTEAAVAWLNSDAAAQADRGRGADAGRQRRCPHRQRRRRRRPALPGFGRHLDAHQARPGGRVPRLGAAHRRRPVEGPGLSGLPLRAAGAGRAGGLARHPALRYRSQPAGLARLAGTPQAAGGREALHRGIPRPHRPHRLRPMVSACRRRRRLPRRSGSRTCSFC